MKVGLVLLILLTQNSFASDFVMNYKNINSLYSSLCFLVKKKDLNTRFIEINHIQVDIENTGPYQEQKMVTVTGECFQGIKVPSEEIRSSELEIFSQFNFDTKNIEGTIGLNQFIIKKQDNKIQTIEIYDPITAKTQVYKLKGSNWTKINSVLVRAEDEIQIYINKGKVAAESSDSYLEFTKENYRHFDLHSYESFGCYHPKAQLKEQECRYYYRSLTRSLN